MKTISCKLDKRVPFLGSSSISQESLSYILQILPKNKNILMIGSGKGSLFLSKFYNILSVEHDEEYINCHDIKYLYAPLVLSPENILWYDLEVIKKCLNKKYDMIIVDGPPGSTSDRIGFLMVLDFIKDLENTILVIDDVQRPKEMHLANSLKQQVERDFVIVESFTKNENMTELFHFRPPKYKLTAFFEVA